MFTITLPCPNCHKNVTVDDISVKGDVISIKPFPLVCPGCSARLTVKIGRPDKGPVLVYLDRDDS